MNAVARAAPAYQDTLEHLLDEFRCLEAGLGRAVHELRGGRPPVSTGAFQGLFLSDEEIDRLLAAGGAPAAGLDSDRLDRHRAEIDARVLATATSGRRLRLPHLCAVFGLSAFESDALLLALAPEWDLRYQRIYAYLHDDVTRKRPSVELALRLFCRSPGERAGAREAFAESAPLTSVPLLSTHEDPAERGGPLLARTLKVEDRVVRFLFGSDELDDRLLHPRRLARWVAPRVRLTDLVVSQDALGVLGRIAQQQGTPWTCVLHGPEGVGKKSAAEAVCQVRACSMLVADADALLRSDTPPSTALRSVFREARLYGSAVYLDRWEELLRDDPRAGAALGLAEEEMERFPGLVFVGCRSPWWPRSVPDRPAIAVALEAPALAERRQIWERCLAGADHALDAGHLASAFRFTEGQVRRALARAEANARLADTAPALGAGDVLSGCRAESTQRIISFARRINPRRTWSDLVLPADTLAQLQELGQQVRHRARVYGEWGFDRRLSLGKGMVALFAGPSGTGKTLSAEILAHELGLDLYRVDLSSVVSKYIGETEKHLEQVFADAQDSSAILFFDEADALFGKRSEVKDAHDRYANIEVNYLLQRVEEHEGVIILASNLSKNIDQAFLRRLHVSIELPFPDEAHRLHIWRRIFPPETPLAPDVDFAFLARQFRIAGGHIRNVALAAAFRAAEEGCAVGMRHLVLAMKREYQKLGRVCERSEFDVHFDLVR
jgi:AAA+ superfamily predicted ATPase